jgi:PKHD-type hydroxylase
MNQNIANQPEKTLAPYVFLENVFSPDDCDRVMDIGRTRALQPGQVSGSDADNSMRDSSVTLLKPDADTQWMYDRVFDVVSRFNNQLWRFELAGAEPMQFAAYGVDQHYDWHVDLWANKPKNARKLSVSVQLNASEEYEGGSFEVDQSGAPNAIGPRAKGAMILFPSYVLHRVQPVTSGIRHSLVTWFVGETGFR